MKLRIILLVLSLLVLVSTSVGGLLYFRSLQEAAYVEARRHAATRAQMISTQFSSFLSQNLRPARVLAGLEELQTALIHPTAENIVQCNLILDHFRQALEVDVCYLMDGGGRTVATSNRFDEDSFLDKNFNFRPYFKRAVTGDPATYMALGTASNKRGVYYSHPVYGEGADLPVGVVVIKASVAPIENEIIQAYEGTVVLSDPHGVIFLSTNREWLFHTLWPLTPRQAEGIAESMQFGDGPWEWTGLEIKANHQGVDPAGNEFLVQEVPIADYPGWKVIYLRNLDAISSSVLGPMFRTTGMVILGLILMTGLAVFFLYRKAGSEIVKRRAVEEQLRKSNERYRSLYHHTPALLHSIDASGRLVSVSEHWTEALGYSPEEVVGRHLTSFMTEESRRFAEKTVFAEFFRTGVCKDVPYCFLRKDGKTIDVLLSAIAERDSEGTIVRSLAVLVDITERKRAEEALTLAKEQLDNYSRELERQVRERTQEFTSILNHTPAVVTMLDAQGRYVLVNSKYEELFGISNEKVLGKTQFEVFPPRVARELQRHDRRALVEKRSIQVEETIPVNGLKHTYLSIKYPVLDENGEATRVCGIAMDITDLKKAQDQLRRLSGNIMASQEQERASIARELHDELGQVLTALRMDTVWLRDRLKGVDHKGMQRIQSMCELIDSTISDVRNIATRLRPAVLDDLGLIDALDWFTTDFEKRTGIACVFSHINVPQVEDHIATAAYRIAQEALTNVARHSNASNVDVVLQGRDNMLTLAVMDNGCGFDVLSLADARELGVAGMRERAGLAGGVLDIVSLPNRGTKVYFRLPMPLHKEAA